MVPMPIVNDRGTEGAGREAKRRKVQVSQKKRTAAETCLLDRRPLSRIKYSIPQYLLITIVSISLCHTYKK